MESIGLCGGTGALDLAAHALYGAVPVAWAETARAATAVLRAHWPDAQQCGAVESVRAAELPGVQLVTAGWPCQPWGMGGRRRGAEDHRAIWPACARLIAALAPRVVILENVAHVAKTGELRRVLGDLAALGFHAEWITYRACCAGAPHQRSRVFVLAAHPERGGLPPRCVPAGSAGGAAGEERPSDRDGWDAARRAGLTARLGGWGPYAPAVAGWEHVTGRAVPAPRIQGARNPAFWEWMMGLPSGWLDPAPRAARIALAGNGVVWQAAAAALGIAHDRLAGAAAGARDGR